MPERAGEGCTCPELYVQYLLDVLRVLRVSRITWGLPLKVGVDAASEIPRSTPKNEHAVKFEHPLDSAME